MSKENTPFPFSIEQREILLNDFRNYLKAAGKRPNTVRNNSSTTNVFLDWASEQAVSYLEITYTDLLAYINHYKARGNAKSTINEKLQGIKHFYNYLQQKELVLTNPVAELSIKNVIIRQPHDLIDWEDLELLYQNFSSSNITGKRNKVILGMLIYQGLTSGEIASLTPKDIHLEEAKIYISSTGKSNSRTLKMEASQILQLQNYITQVRPILMTMKGDNCHSKSLFISSGNGNRLDNSLALLTRNAKKVNPNIKNPTQIRASVITHWLKIHHIRQVQYMIGHRYISSTERYQTHSLESLQEQIDELHPLK